MSVFTFGIDPCWTGTDFNFVMAGVYWTRVPEIPDLCESTSWFDRGYIGNFLVELLDECIFLSLIFDLGFFFSSDR